MDMNNSKAYRLGESAAHGVATCDASKVKTAVFAFDEMLNTAAEKERPQLHQEYRLGYAAMSGRMFGRMLRRGHWTRR